MVFVVRNEKFHGLTLENIKETLLRGNWKSNMLES